VRICFVTETYPPEVNGVALSVERVVQGLRQRGHAVELIRPRQAHEARLDTTHEWRTAGMPIPMYRGLRLGWAPWRALRQRFRQHRTELVHIVTQGPLGRSALRAARSLGLPVTTDFRTNFHLYARHYRLGWLEATVRNNLLEFHNAADATFAPTRALCQTLARDGFERVERVGRGVDTLRFSPERRSDELRRRWGADAATPVLLYVGRLAAEKDVGLALRTWEHLRRVQPRLRMVLVGDGPQRAQLQQRHPDAVFCGERHGAALAEHYASGDVFLFPSRTDTFGNVTLEALASGLIVVAFQSAAAAEVIGDGVSGLLAPPDDAAAWMQQVQHAVARAPHLQPMRARARQAALGADWHAVLDRFESRLKRIAFERNDSLPVSGEPLMRAGPR
jgi:glycosyltransferase involved in cell wall biosynthesis